MARKLRVEFKGAIYHVTARMLGDWKREDNRLFEDDADRKRFLECLAGRVEQYGIRLYVFVLMANHVHLVFETPFGNCSKFMQALLTAYTVYFNLRHQRHGHLFDGRYKAKLVEGDEYLLALSRYVHLNPVQVGEWGKKSVAERMRFLRVYPWSSYPGYIGTIKGLDFVEYDPIWLEVSADGRACARRYRKYVETGCSSGDDGIQAAMRVSPHGIGSESFCAWVGGMYRKRVEASRHLEDVSFRDARKTLDIATILSVLTKVFETPEELFRRRRRNSVLRGVAARFLCKYAGLTQREVADVLEMGSGAAVSHQMRKLAGLLESDRRLRRQVTETGLLLDRQSLGSARPDR